jgi:hypothetical protein
MKRIAAVIILLTVIISACNKPASKEVIYRTTGAVSAYNLQYLDGQNILVKTEVVPQSKEDVWEYDFEAEEGDIVYVNGKYNDINSGLKIQVLIDGKIYKQASSEGDTVNYLVVSGTIPYE